MFMAEVEMLNSCKHPNIISLIGFCMESDEMIIVVEYAVHGSLNDYYISDEFNLNWAQRLQICLDTAKAIIYLHTSMKGKPIIIHRDIKSDNILLDENMNVKLIDFGLSKFHYRETQDSDILTQVIAGTEYYMDPEYFATGMYNINSDTYSFGVVLLKVLSGRAAYDRIYQNRMGLAPIVRRRFKDGTLKELLDPKMLKEDDDLIFTLNREPNQDSFDAFSKIAYECLAETQDKRPTMKVVIKELQNALNLQGETLVLMRFRLSDIVLATENFTGTDIGLDTNGTVYKAELHLFGSNNLLAIDGKNDSEPSKKRITVAIKRIARREDQQRKQGFFEELEMRAYKHPNMVRLLGFCDEGEELMLVYEHASDHRSLDDYLKNVNNMDSFTWAHRLRMCLEIARGIAYLHTKTVDQSIIRTAIRSANILLDKNQEAKIGYFVISNLRPINQDMSMKVYEDPAYETCKLERNFDMYSFGVVLFEFFCGRVAYDQVYTNENDRGLAPIARQCLDDGTIKSIMDPRLKEETKPEDMSTSNRETDQDSLDAFLRIAYACLGEADKRPTMEVVIKELERALNFQEPKQVE